MKSLTIIDIKEGLLYFTVSSKDSKMNELFSYCLETGKMESVPSHIITNQVFKTSTIKYFLQTAIKPIGSTNYVWKGGHDAINSTRIGVNSKWREFFLQQDSSYNWTTTKYQFDNGLDCSGYVSWVIYNTFNEESGKDTFITLAKDMSELYKLYGWGSIRTKEEISQYRAGDLMFCDKSHICIIIGRCDDGSVVLFHSSPPGVQISGTVSPSGEKNSEAVQLAESYMKKYFPEWYEKYPHNKRNIKYLTDYHQFNWNISEDGVMSDPDCLQEMKPEEVLQVIFENYSNDFLQ